MTDPGSTDTAQASTLCTACGLCCMGALHKAAALQPGEIPGARAIGLPVLPERPAFSLPCPHFTGSACAIYEQRPRACVNYRCQQLKDLDAGITDLDGALVHVRAAKAMMEALQALLPEALRRHSARSLLADEATLARELSGLPQRQRMELRLMLTALQLYFDKHFRGDKEEKALAILGLEEVGPAA